MGLLWRFLDSWRAWDMPSKVAFVLACALLLVVGGLLLGAAESMRPLVLVGFVGLLIVLQGIVLWGNRHMVTPYTQAQRAFLAGDFARAYDVLATWLAIDKGDLAQIAHKHNDGVVLLGNVCRQLGDLAQSEMLLRQAVVAHPSSHFAWYGLGRTQLALGQYQESLTSIKKSLSLGAPSGIQFEIGHSYVRLGDSAAARPYLAGALAAQEAHRRLLAHWWLAQLGEQPMPAHDLVQQGLPFWQEEAKRFAHTPYGQAVAHEVRALIKLTQEG